MLNLPVVSGSTLEEIRKKNVTVMARVAENASVRPDATNAPKTTPTRSFILKPTTARPAVATISNRPTMMSRP